MVYFEDDTSQEFCLWIVCREERRKVKEEESRKFALPFKFATIRCLNRNSNIRNFEETSLRRVKAIFRVREKV